MDGVRVVLRLRMMMCGMAILMRIVLIAVTVITRVLLELKPIVVHEQKVIAGENTPCVCLTLIVKSVATHGLLAGQGVHNVANFLSETNAKTTEPVRNKKHEYEKDRTGT